MKDGFIKTAAGTVDVVVADVQYNTEQILARMREADAAGVNLLTLPELAPFFTVTVTVCAASDATIVSGCGVASGSMVFSGATVVSGSDVVVIASSVSGSGDASVFSVFSCACCCTLFCRAANVSSLLSTIPSCSARSLI